MKRTFAILALALALGGVTYPHRLDAQSPSSGPSVEAAKQSIDEIDQRLGKAISTFFAKHPLNSAEKRDALREELRPLVDEAFNARQRLQEAELDALRRRLAEIEQAIQTREKNRAIIINARLDELVTGRSVSGQRAGYLERRITVDGKEAIVPVPIYAVPRPTSPALTPTPAPVSTQDPNARTATADAQPPVRAGGQRRMDARGEQAEVPFADYDIETRERLAQIDVTAAEEDLAGAEKGFQRTRALSEQGSISAQALTSSEKELRHAKAELERAKAKRNGLARQRTELEEAATAAVADAQAQRNQADAKLAETEAALATGEAQHEERLAAVEAIRAKIAQTQERYTRLHELDKEGAVSARQLREQEAAIENGKADLATAVGSVKTAEAVVAGLKPAIDAAKAELQRADRRVEAAQARLTRLKQPAANQPAAAELPGAGPAPTDKQPGEPRS